MTEAALGASFHPEMALFRNLCVNPLISLISRKIAHF